MSKKNLKGAFKNVFEATFFCQFVESNFQYYINDFKQKIIKYLTTIINTFY